LANVEAENSGKILISKIDFRVLQQEEIHHTAYDVPNTQ
jgi:hypothetical protein